MVSGRIAQTRSTRAKSSAAISRQSSPKAKTPRPWLMLKPSHAFHIVGARRPAKRMGVPSIAVWTEGSRGAKYVGRTVSTSVSSACSPPAKIIGTVPAMTQPCALMAGKIHTGVLVGAAGYRRAMTTHAERSARTRGALLESAARGLSRYGYGNLRLEQVAREAGYTRGALYHQFDDKEDLALAVLHWANETWQREVGALADEESD